MPAANTLDPDEFVVGANGRVRVAPVGTTAPTNFSASYSASWLDLGYLTEDGFTWTPGMETRPTTSWQSFYPTRHTVVSRSLDFNFTMQQWSETTIPFALGGGEFTTTGTGATEIHTYTPPAPGDIDYRALSFEWEDGDKQYRLFIAKGMVTDLAEITVNRGDEATLGVTFGAIPVDTEDPYYWYTNDDAMAEGS